MKEKKKYIYMQGELMKHSYDRIIKKKREREKLITM